MEDNLNDVKNVPATVREEMQQSMFRQIQCKLMHSFHNIQYKDGIPKYNIMYTLVYRTFNPKTAITSIEPGQPSHPQGLDILIK